MLLLLLLRLPKPPIEHRKLTLRLDEKPGDPQDDNALTNYPDHPVGAAQFELKNCVHDPTIMCVLR